MGRGTKETMEEDEEKEKKRDSKVRQWKGKMGTNLL